MEELKVVLPLVPRPKIGVTSCAIDYAEGWTVTSAPGTVEPTAVQSNRITSPVLKVGLVIEVLLAVVEPAAIVTVPTSWFFVTLNRRKVSPDPVGAVPHVASSRLIAETPGGTIQLVDRVLMTASVPATLKGGSDPLFPCK